MTREEAIKILENEKECVNRAEYCDRQCGKCELVKEDNIILKALDIAIEALEQEPKTWSLDDAREDFMSDVYDTLDFLPTNNECNKIIDSFDRVTSGIKKEPKSEWQKDHEILKAYSDGANGVLDEVRAEIKAMSGDIETLSDVLQIIDKYRTESEVENE